MSNKCEIKDNEIVGQKIEFLDYIENMKCRETIEEERSKLVVNLKKLATLILDKTCAPDLESK